ncbi:MAG: cytochrome c biogenesis protein CcdA [Candidatus Woesearchaeota archaeon]
MNESKKKILFTSIAIVIIAAAFVFLGGVSPDALEGLSSSVPLPIFTFIIALIDGFNPCNLMVLTMLVSLMLTESHSRKRILAVSLTFVAVIYIFYFIFMAAWVNIFKFIGFIDPLRYAIAAVAIIAGLINIKELFFFRKGITLMIQDKHVGPVKRRIKHVAHLIKKGSMPTLIGASAVLAIFASLVELPCTAGFPLIYTGILSGVGLESGVGHYLYLLLYNLFYVLPLLAIMLLFTFTFKGKQVDKKTMARIKFVGGIIMLLLGLILLINPSLIIGG